MSGSEPDRLPCRTAGCPNTVQPATAARNGGYCGPCKGKQNAEARRAFVQANRRDLDRYAGVADPVELLRLMHTPPTPDPLVRLLPPPRTFEQLYLSLTLADARRLMNLAADMFDADVDVTRAIGMCLAAFTTLPVEELVRVLLDRNDPYPAIVFRAASGATRDRLIAILHDGTPMLRVNHALSALAWVGDEAVVQFLGAAEVARPKWSHKLHVGPAAYARTAGWELADGQRRELTFGTCVVLHVAGENDPGTDRVVVMANRSDRCPWCGGPLASLVVADLTAPPLDAFLHLGERIEVMTCLACACFGPVHGELDGSGHGRWAAANVRPKFVRMGGGGSPNPWSTATIHLAPRLATHGADWTLPTTLSQIGGLPAWVQDAEYPTCLTCGRTMVFLAQIDQAAFPRHEGMYYAFVCPSCRTTATTYQQT